MRDARSTRPEGVKGVRIPAGTTTTIGEPDIAAASSQARCAVRGLIRSGLMCGRVVVGGERCGYSGACPHKISATSAGGAHA